jgi:hypothetical protein
VILMLIMSLSYSTLIRFVYLHFEFLRRFNCTFSPIELSMISSKVVFHISFVFVIFVIQLNAKSALLLFSD